jgi:peptidoglycan hydrolase-like protein with peptidoglycan-binding domain
LRKLILTTVSVLALGIGAADLGHAATYSMTAPGPSGYEVRQAQLQLRNLGLYHGAIDGIVGQGTDRALRRFQMSSGLAVTATLDPQTMARLVGGQAAVTPPSYNQTSAAYPIAEEVREAQQRLRDVGLYHGAIDGIFGPQTRHAVERFQTINGLAVTAALDQQTMSKLLPHAAPGVGSSTTPSPTR